MVIKAGDVSEEIWGDFDDDDAYGDDDDDDDDEAKTEILQRMCGILALFGADPQANGELRAELLR